MKFRFLALTLLLTPLFLQSVCLAEEVEQTLNIEELSKTKAAQLFVQKKYGEALEEFKLLEKDAPKNLLIKRYIAALYDTLRDWDAATYKLLEILVLDPDEITARQMLAEVYVKKGSLAKAKEQYQKLIEKIPGTPPAISAQHELKKLNRIQNISSSVKGERMAFEAFMNSEPTRKFTAGKFKEALQGFETLLRDYPRDILIHRFRAITLSRLEQYDESIEAFNQALSIDPTNVATHFYLGQTYRTMGEAEKARDEFRWVIENDETSYQIRAKQELFATLARGRKPDKPWSVSLTNSYEYDTNATYKPRDNNFSSAGDQNSGRYTTTLSGTYRFASLGKWSFTGDALYSQTLYNDFPNLRTYTPGIGISGLYRFNIFEKPAFFNLRHGMTHTILRNKSYVYSNSTSANLITFLHNRLRSTMTYRWGWNKFDASGVLPEITDRDGITQAASVGSTFYLNDKRNLYVGATYEWEDVSTEGTNSIKQAHGARLRIHLPVIEKVEGDILFRFKNSDYPKFTTPLKRNDTLFSLRVQLSRPLWDYLTLVASYQWEDVSARNNIYEYSKHVTGLELAYRY